MIRPNLMQQLRQALTGDGFEADDFLIETKTTTAGNTTLAISSRFAGGFDFEATIPKRRGSSIAIEVKPGAIAQEETLAIENWEQIVAEVRGWRSRMAAELKAEPVARKLDAQNKELEKLLSSVGKVEDS